MQSPDLLKITTDEIHWPVFFQKGIEADMLRLDKIHPVISGNKWFKLKYHFENFYNGNYNGIITYGGAWSNHLIATAFACSLKGIKSVGIIRGEKPPLLSSTLQQAQKCGMQLEFITRELYKRKEGNEFAKTISEKFSNFYVVPEGGAGMEGEKGAGEILNLVSKNIYTHIACAVGTSTMFNGIAKLLKPDQHIIGIPVIKGRKETEEKNSVIISRYHFGGYAKYNPELTGFMNDFYRQTNIPTDFVYTGKLSFAIGDLAKKDFFKKNNKILIIHSGGLQGNDSLPPGTLIF